MLVTHAVILLFEKLSHTAIIAYYFKCILDIIIIIYENQSESPQAGAPQKLEMKDAKHCNRSCKHVEIFCHLFNM